MMRTNRCLPLLLVGFLLGWGGFTGSSQAQILHTQTGEVIPGTEGIFPGQGVDLAGWNTPGHTLQYANLMSADLTNVSFNSSDLSNSDFTGSNLTKANFFLAMVEGANFEGAVIKGANFGRTRDSGQPLLTYFTVGQLYSTASYAEGDLSGVGLFGHDLGAWDFGNQNLTGARFDWSDLTNASFESAKLTGAGFEFANVTGANFTNAVIKGAKLATSTGFTVEQLYSTASYVDGDLAGVIFPAASNWAGVNFVGKNLTGIRIARFLFPGSPGLNLTDADFTGAQLKDADFTGSTLINANFTSANAPGVDLSFVNLTNANFTGAILTGVRFAATNLTNANFTSAELAGVSFSSTTITGATWTNSNLTDANFFLRKDLTNANFGGANLTRTNLQAANLTNANFAGAVIKSTNFAFTEGFTADQLYSTASYANRDLSGTVFSFLNLTGWNFANQNLSGAGFPNAILVNADFRRTGISLPASAVTRNTILSTGAITGLQLLADETLVIRNNLTPVTVQTSVSLDPSSTLQFLLAENWTSPMRFRISSSEVALVGTLELEFAPGANLRDLMGDTFKVFDWTSVTPSGGFTVASPYRWDLSKLYTTGEVTLVPEPTAIVLASVLALLMRARHH